MRKLALIALLLAPPWLKRLLLRAFWGAKIGRGVRIGWFAAVTGKEIELGDYSEIRSFSTVRCGAVRIGAYSVVGSYVQIYGPAAFTMGRHSIVGNHSQVNVWEDVRLGDVTALGPNCMVLTHGTFLPYTEGYWVKFAPVTIGDRVWIASGVFIQPGIRIGNEVFVNSMSVVKRDIPDGAIVEGYPAREVGRMEKLKRTMTPQRLDTAAEAMLEHFAEVALRRERGIEAASDVPGRLRFRCGSRDYLIACVPTEVPAADGLRPTAYGLRPPASDDWAGAGRVILLVSRPNWAPPAGKPAPLVIDLTTLRTRRPRDPIHLGLTRFLVSYYGVPLEYAE